MGNRCYISGSGNSVQILSTQEIYCELKFLIANCTDENLRDELIKTAAKFLLRNC